MKWKAIERRQAGAWKRGPSHIMKTDNTTWCGFVTERRGTRYSEVWLEVPEPRGRELCRNCKAAHRREGN